VENWNSANTDLYSPQPPWRLMPTAPGVPRRRRRRVRTASSPDPPGSSWRLIKGPSHTGSSRTPLRPARQARTIWQCWHVLALSGLLPPSPAPPGSGCPQLRRPAATGTAVKVSHLHSNHSASRRTHDLRHLAATLALAAGVEMKVVSAHAAPQDARDYRRHLHVGAGPRWPGPPPKPPLQSFRAKPCRTVPAMPLASR
jgi:hypothetical protein